MEVNDCADGVLGLPKEGRPLGPWLPDMVSLPELKDQRLSSLVIKKGLVWVGEKVGDDAHEEMFSKGILPHNNVNWHH